jgi:hypothetical protein
VTYVLKVTNESVNDAVAHLGLIQGRKNTFGGEVSWGVG